MEIVAAGDGGRRRRRKHSPQFKAAVVAACRKPGVSIESVALVNRLNANLVRRWVRPTSLEALPSLNARRRTASGGTADIDGLAAKGCKRCIAVRAAALAASDWLRTFGLGR